MSGEAELRPMSPQTEVSVAIPAYNEVGFLENQLDALFNQVDFQGRPLDKNLYEVLVVDNCSADDTSGLVRAYAAKHENFRLFCVSEKEKGVSFARKRGMDAACERSRERDRRSLSKKPLHILSTDADCRVDPGWVFAFHEKLKESDAVLCVGKYRYPEAHFADRPRLWRLLELKDRTRWFTSGVFGGFPCGKGFAVTRAAYEGVGGIEIFYQVQEGRFFHHPADDWDFGIKVRANGGEICFCPEAGVEINPRRVDFGLADMIRGHTYGKGGSLDMGDIRTRQRPPGLDLNDEEEQSLWKYTMTDFVHKEIILPVFLTPALFGREACIDFFSPDLADRLEKRIAQVKDEMGMHTFLAIHSWKTPCYRLYLEFAEELFQRMNEKIDPGIGEAPPFPPCLQEIKDRGDRDQLRQYIYFFAEDRESGEAHDYFGNGGGF